MTAANKDVLTRLGMNRIAIANGDITRSDLTVVGVKSGLSDAMSRFMEDMEMIGVSAGKEDCVRQRCANERRKCVPDLIISHFGSFLPGVMPGSLYSLARVAFLGNHIYFL